LEHLHTSWFGNNCNEAGQDMSASQQQQQLQVQQLLQALPEFKRTLESVRSSCSSGSSEAADAAAAAAEEAAAGPAASAGGLLSSTSCPSSSSNANALELSAFGGDGLQLVKHLVQLVRSSCVSMFLCIFNLYS
jgi:ApbE superfamily uncharacterized protein (UPF0280 family)